MGMRVAVAGASGYAGGELLRLIAGHPDLELAIVTAGGSVGQRVGDLHANLAGARGLADRLFEPPDLAELSGCDLVFLALPAGQSAAMAAGIADSAKIVDLGPDFRLADAGAWARYYGGQHAGRWTTGLPELPGARERIRAAGRVAAPGCYATAAILALAPLVAAGLAEPDDVVIVAASGTSGAGRAARADLLGSEVMGSVSAYQAGGAHRHIPEIEQALAEAAEAVGSAKATGAAGSAGAGAARTAEAAGAAGPAGVAGQAGVAGSAGVAAGTALEGGCPAGQGGHDVRVCFTPLLAPMPRGILATCTARLTAGFGTAAIRSALAAAYDGEPFVCLLPDGRWPGTGAVAGSNGVHLQAAADPGAGRVTVAVAIDNLGKGAAGQAIQDANLMLGLAETAGLTSIGVAP